MNYQNKMAFRIKLPTTRTFNSFKTEDQVDVNLSEQAIVTSKTNASGGVMTQGNAQVSVIDEEKGQQGDTQIMMNATPFDDGDFGTPLDEEQHMVQSAIRPSNQQQNQKQPHTMGENAAGSWGPQPQMNIEAQQGLRGDRGPRGDKGDCGEKGQQGERGETGQQGERGEKGDKGERGEKGQQGERGEKGDKGEVGRAAPKIVLWNGSVELLTSEPQSVCTIPYNGTIYSLSNIDIVVQGSGLVYVSLTDSISEEVICEGNQDLGGDDKVYVFSTSSFNNLRSDHTVLSLNMNSSGTNTAKVLAVEFSM